ncbi:uncharacterized protein LOC133516656 [Cydia pomonella]|uniref:uncharacterized protein LOC133516656 n=1 Tax=Cydia pomonella TaxID=82600 RepID=UPI002ADDC8D0|nr:uncharacterized protein LOC133516656 [Cydia pomonella]
MCVASVVRLPHTGRQLSVPWHRLRAVRLRFTALRALAIESHLAGISPVGGRWHESASELLAQHAGRDLQLLAHDSRRRSLGAVLLDLNGPACLNRELLAKQLATADGSIDFEALTAEYYSAEKESMPQSPVSNENATCKNYEAMTRSYQDEFRPGSKETLRLEAKILHCESPSLIYISLVHQQKAFNELFEDIQKFYAKRKTPRRERWKVNDRCCAFCMQSQTWRRATILKTKKDQVIVFFTDFAQTETVPISNLKKVHPNFEVIGDAAIKCHLAELMPANGEWPSLTKEFLKDKLEEYKRVFVTKVGEFKREDKSMPVQLWVYHTELGSALEPNESEWRCLNAELASRGLAVDTRQIEGVTSGQDDELRFLNVRGSVQEWLLPPLPGSTSSDEVAEWLPAEPLRAVEFTALPTSGCCRRCPAPPASHELAEWLPAEPSSSPPCPRECQLTLGAGVAAAAAARLHQLRRGRRVAAGRAAASRRVHRPAHEWLLPPLPGSTSSDEVAEWLPAEPLRAVEFTALPTSGCCRRCPAPPASHELAEWLPAEPSSSPPCPRECQLTLGAGVAAAAAARLHQLRRGRRVAAGRAAASRRVHRPAHEWLLPPLPGSTSSDEVAEWLPAEPLRAVEFTALPTSGCCRRCPAPPASHELAEWLPAEPSSSPPCPRECQLTLGAGVAAAAAARLHQHPTSSPIGCRPSRREWLLPPLPGSTSSPRGRRVTAGRAVEFTALSTGVPADARCRSGCCRRCPAPPAPHEVAEWLPAEPSSSPPCPRECQLTLGAGVAAAAAARLHQLPTRSPSGCWPSRREWLLPPLPGSTSSPRGRRVAAGRAVEFTALPTYIDNEGVIYLHDVSQEDDLEFIRDTLEMAFKEEDPKAPYCTWRVGEPCVARYYLDSKFYRGTVLEVNHDQANCLVQYVDYGNSELCAFTDLRKRIALHQIPIQSHKVSLARIKPVGEQWDQTVLDYIHKAIVEKKCFVKVVAPQVNGVTPVDLKYDKLWINDHLVEFDLAEYIDGSKPIDRKLKKKSIYASSKPEKNNRNESETKVIEINSGSEPDYIVEEDIDSSQASGSPDSFKMRTLVDQNGSASEKDSSNLVSYLRHEDREFSCNIPVINDTNSLELMIIQDAESHVTYEALLDIVKEVGKNMPPLDGIYEYKPCIALFEDYWYRASILKYSEEKNLVKVHYVDYGNIGIVPLSNVREISKDWVCLPPVCITARLHGVRVNPDRVQDDVTKAYVDTFLDKGPFRATIVDYDNLVPLVELRNADGELVYKKLIEEKVLLHDTRDCAASEDN